MLIGSNTLVPGGPAATIGGQVVSAGNGGVNVGGSTIPLTTPPPSNNGGSVGVLPLVAPGSNQGPIQNQQVALAPGQSIAAQVQQPAPAVPGSPQPSPFIALPGGARAEAGGAPATVDGHVVSLAPDGRNIVVDGSNTQAVTGAPSFAPGAGGFANPNAVQQVVSTGSNGIATTGNVVAGTTLVPGGPPATVQGHSLTAASDGGVIIDGTSTARPLGSALSNGAFSITIGPTLGAPQLAAAQPTSIVGPNGQSTAAQIIDGTTVTAGAPATQIQGHAVSVAPGGGIIVDNAPASTNALGSVTLAPPGAPQTLSASPVVTTGANGQVTTAQIVGGQTLTPGASATISGHVFSVNPTGGIVADGGATLTPDSSGKITVANNGIIAGQQTVTTGTDGKTTLQDVIGGRTLRAGGPAETISGHAVSLASNGAIVVDGTQSLMPSGAPVTAKPAAATFSLSGVPGSVTASSTYVTGKDGKTTAAAVLGSSTITAGQTVTVSGHAVSLESDGDIVVDGSSTVPAATASGVGVGGSSIPSVSASATATTMQGVSTARTGAGTRTGLVGSQSAAAGRVERQRWFGVGVGAAMVVAVL